jgi:hypothetical protein
MAINRRDNRQDNLNKPGKYEKGDQTFELPRDKDGNPKLGWVSQPDPDREFQYRYFNLDDMELSSPLKLEDSLPWPSVVDGQSVIDAYDQIGGTCVGASGAQATTGRHERRNPGAGEKFDYIALYCKCRSIMGDNSCNKNAGATMQSVGKALQNWGGAQVIGGKSQPALQENGVLIYSWGYDADALRTAIGNGIYVQIGISIYQAFLSPKKVGNDWWVYWQTGSWGSMLGGHAMMTCWWSDKRDAFYLPNTWGLDFPGSWLSRASFTRLLGAAQPAEILLCIDRAGGPPAPQGKLALQKFFIVPALPVVGDRVQFTFEAKNTGPGPLTGIQLGIEEMLYPDVFPDGYRGPVVNLAPGEVTSFNPQSAPITAGNWRWRADNLKPYTVLSTITVDVTGEPPPPPPPPPPPSTDTITFLEETLTDSAGKVYSTKVDHPGGVRYRWVG